MHCLKGSKTFCYKSNIYFSQFLHCIQTGEGRWFGGKSQAQADRTEQLVFVRAHWVMGTNLCDEQKDGETFYLSLSWSIS